MMIERTKELVELKYRIEKGYKADAKVNKKNLAFKTIAPTLGNRNTFKH